MFRLIRLLQSLGIPGKDSDYQGENPAKFQEFNGDNVVLVMIVFCLYHVVLSAGPPVEPSGEVWRRVKEEVAFQPRAPLFIPTRSGWYL